MESAQPPPHGPAPGAAGSGSAPPAQADIGWPFWFSLGACAGIALGSIGPWVDALFLTVSGFDGDGVITLACAAIAAGALAHGRTRNSWGLAALVSAVAALAAGATAVYDLVQIYDAAGTEIFGKSVRLASPGWGIWLVAIGSLALLIGAWHVEQARERG